jgi:hypothetical protein
VIKGVNMAKHIGSGCEGQACLRKEGEGSGTIGKTLNRIVAGPLSGILVSGIIADPYLEHDLDREFDEVVMIEEHIHEEIPAYVHAGGSGSSYSSSGGGSGRSDSDEAIVIKGRVKIAIGGFRARNLELYPDISDLTEKRIQKSMIKHLNEFEGVTAEELEEAIKPYEKWEIDEEPERLYKITGLNAVINGSYEVYDPPEGPDDGDLGITVTSMHAYWGNGNAFDVRMYKESGLISELESLCVSLARKIVGEHISPATTSPERVCVVVFVAFEFAVSR